MCKYTNNLKIICIFAKNPLKESTLQYKKKLRSLLYTIKYKKQGSNFLLSLKAIGYKKAGLDFVKFSLFPYKDKKC